MVELSKHLEKIFHLVEKRSVLLTLSDHVTKYLLTLRHQIPQLYFLYDNEVGDILEAGTEPTKFLAVARRIFDSVKDFKVAKESDHGGGSSADQFEHEECYLDGIITAHDEVLLLPKSVSLGKGVDVFFLDHLERHIKFVTKLDIFKAWTTLAYNDSNPIVLIDQLKEGTLCSQALFVANEAVFFFSLGVVMKVTGSQIKGGKTAESAKAKEMIECMIVAKNELIKKVMKEKMVSRIDRPAFYWYCIMKFVQQEKHFLDILEGLNKLENIDEVKFEYLSLPKMYITPPKCSYSYEELLKSSIDNFEKRVKKDKGVITPINGFLKGKILNLGEVESFSRNLEIVVECGDGRVEYGFELQNQMDEYYLYPLTEHYLYQITTTLSNQTFPMFINKNPKLLANCLKVNTLIVIILVNTSADMHS